MFETFRDAWAQAARPLGALLTLIGVCHLRKPDRLLSLVGQAYDRVLDVDFEPRDGAKNRVRLLGLAFVAAGLHLLFWGGVLPRQR
ncbi:hypothetical protein [Haloarchaeobius sp. DFWS5]|uniref:hypothetical protein n=1 Tax=Haloarchaeobius sp. DFWS5 TaxID=3446114 RepID=UPI003EBFB50E